MSFDYSFVLPPTGQADNAQIREMFEDVKTYVNTLISGGGTGAPVSSQYVTLLADANLTNERVLTSGSGISLTDNGAGSTVVITNIGVTSLASADTFANLTVSAATGNLSINFSHTPTFSSLILQSVGGSIGITPSASAFTGYNLTLPLDTGSSGYILTTNGATPTATLSWTNPATGFVTDISGTADQISVSSTVGSVTLSTPQNIATTSSPTFVELFLGSTVGSALPILFGGTLDGIGHDSSSRAVSLKSQSTTATLSELGSPIHSSYGIFQVIGGSISSYIRLLNGSNYVDILPHGSSGNYTLVMPVDDGSSNQYLTTDGSGNLSWSNAAGTGTVNTGFANQLAYYASATDAVSPMGAITANRALISDTNGLPTHSSVTATTLAFLDATSSVQTQLNGKASTALGNLASVAINTSLLPSSDNSIDLGSSSKRWVSLFAKDIDAGASGTAGTVDIYPGTSSKGKIQLTAADNSGDTTTTIVNASQGGARTYTIPDAGASASFVMTNGTQTISGTKTFDGQLIGKGTGTNDNASAGYVGEVAQSSSTSAASAASTGTFANFVSISLTAGDWDVSGILELEGNGATWTAFTTAISINSGNTTTDHVRGDNSINIQLAGSGASDNYTLTIPAYRISLSGTTTVYLKGNVEYSAGTPQLRAGRISARRVR